MADKNINKVVLGDTVLIDLTSDTLDSQDKVLKGFTAHINTGATVTGTADYIKTVTSVPLVKDTGIIYNSTNQKYYLWRDTV